VVPPPSPVREGREATFFVDSRGRPYRWQVRRFGTGEPVARGRGSGPRLEIRAPRGHSGAYGLEVCAQGFRTEVPFLVQSDRTRPILVVVPMITWLGEDRVDDDGDGLPDSLRAGVPVRHEGRVLRGRRGLPARFAEEVAPLLVYMDRVGVRYDIASDLGLDFARAPSGERQGVLLAGPFTWVSRRLAQRLRGYVEGGGRVASFGAGTLRRGVFVGPERLVRPTQPTPDDPFGARLDDLRRVGDGAQLAPLPGTQPAHPLLTAWSGVLSGFSVLEESEERREGPDTVVALGQGLTEGEVAEAEEEGELPREPRPALTASRVGRGLVIRVGLPEWASRLPDPDVNQITHNILDLLRRRDPEPRDPLR
jgi:hypothetical protein